jgi:NAD(P)-dependent dehydrogenase (short-subunit alcohol dehydrogenase family)
MERDLRGIFGLGGRAALVTGGGSGLGRAICEGFSQFGARVAVVDVDGTAAEDVARSLQATGGEAIAIRCDVSDPHQAEEAVAQAIERFGHVDTLVANAGIGARSAAEEMTFDQWTRVIGVNLTGVWLLVTGHILNVDGGHTAV